MKPILVYVVDASFVYFDEIEKRMTERSLDQEFLAKDHCQAIDTAVAWAKNRFEALYTSNTICIIKSYKQSEIGCIKLYQKQIAPGEPDGMIRTQTIGFCLFEWKYDWPGTLQSYVDNFKQHAVSK